MYPPLHSNHHHCPNDTTLSVSNFTDLSLPPCNPHIFAIDRSDVEPIIISSQLSNVRFVVLPVLCHARIGIGATSLRDRGSRLSATADYMTLVQPLTPRPRSAIAIACECTCGRKENQTLEPSNMHNNAMVVIRTTARHTMRAMVMVLIMLFVCLSFCSHEIRLQEAPYTHKLISPLASHAAITGSNCEI